MTITRFHHVHKLVVYFSDIFCHINIIYFIFIIWGIAKKRNKCWILHAHNQGGEIRHEIGGIDEEKAIAYICENVKFDCIGDFCMGQGLVAKYAARFGRRFVGTELNGKRLAVAVERVEKELEKKES